MGRADPPDLKAFSHTGMLPMNYPSGNPGLKDRFSTPQGRTAGVALRVGNWVWQIPSGRVPDRVTAYNLTEDPRETTDVFDPQDPMHVQMARELQAYKSALEQAYSAPASELSREEAEKLRSLGYVK
jgi:hypothetical protein